jgi:hypothetical protein
MVIPIVFEHAPAEIVRSPVLFLMVPDKNNWRTDKQYWTKNMFSFIFSWPLLPWSLWGNLPAWLLCFRSSIVKLRQCHSPRNEWGTVELLGKFNWPGFGTIGTVLACIQLELITTHKGFLHNVFDETGEPWFVGSPCHNIVGVGPRARDNIRDISYVGQP